MTGRITEIFRHPVKAHGREMLKDAVLEPGKCLAWDRVWAVTHDRSKWDSERPEWMRCANFLRGSNAPAIQAIDCVLDESTGRITFTHPEQPSISVNLDDAADVKAFVAWVRPFAGPDGRNPTGIAKVPGIGMTDSMDQGVSLMNHVSRRVLSQRAGIDLSMLRFRGNIWFDGLGPWEEFEWLDREIRLGEARLRVTHRIDRCQVTAANPATGRRDADPPRVLREGWQHEDFGVHAIVIEGGRIAPGDRPEVL